MSIHIHNSPLTSEGLAYDEKRNERLTKEMDILSKRREKANRVRLQALEVINQAPIRIQRIIRFPI